LDHGALDSYVLGPALTASTTVHNPTNATKYLLAGIVIKGPAVGSATVTLREGTDDVDANSPVIVEVVAATSAVVANYFAVPISVEKLRATVTGSPIQFRVARA